MRFAVKFRLPRLGSRQDQANLISGRMISSAVCAQVEATLRDAADLDTARFPAPIYYSLRLHQINAFGYRPDWAETLLAFVRFDSQDRPYFPMSPETPEAHRHKFLCALALSENSPGRWQGEGWDFQAEDFVAPILELPVEEWGDKSIVPEPSWTLQFLSAYLDSAGTWRGKTTALEAVVRRYWEIYFRDFASQDLWHPGRTPFTESGLHFLEAINKLCQRQSQFSPSYLPELKQHLRLRIESSLQESSILLSNSDWMTKDYRHQALEIALSQLLVLGHSLEVAFHPRGALRSFWTSPEWRELEKSAQELAKLMQVFFDPRVQELMDEEKRRAHAFPLLHAYHAIRLSSPEPLTIPRRS